VGKKIINFIFNNLLSILDEHKLPDWSAISLDASNIRAMRCAAGAQKNIPISPVIMAWVPHEAVIFLALQSTQVTLSAMATLSRLPDSSASTGDLCKPWSR
jgi:hypothetical protein